MNIIHTMNGDPLPRHVGGALAARLRAMPATILLGARQTGKSTLAVRMAPGPRRLCSLDDFETLSLARRDPMALLGGPDLLTLDEVQREPGLLRAVKMAIDEHREAGRFLVTGSANLLVMQSVGETLAGRAAYLTLWPMARREQMGRGRCGLWDQLLGAEPREWRDLLMADDAPAEDWRELGARGGFPTPALHMSTTSDRRVWFDGYVRTYLERDLHTVSNVASLPDFRRLMQAVCLRLGKLLNQTDLGRDLGMPQATVHRYLNLLEASYMLVRVPAFATNRASRLIKMPKLYWADVGLAAYLAGVDGLQGEHLENIVLHDLVVWRDARDRRADVFHWRTASNREIDFIVEISGALLPVEVKATTRPTVADARHIRAFRLEHPETALPGLLLHTGQTVGWLTADVMAVPWWRVV
jgi:predicted AAA+ superfamily ATPase